MKNTWLAKIIPVFGALSFSVRLMAQDVGQQEPFWVTKGVLVGVAGMVVIVILTAIIVRFLASWPFSKAKRRGPAGGAQGSR